MRIGPTTVRPGRGVHLWSARLFDQSLFLRACPSGAESLSDLVICFLVCLGFCRVASRLAPPWALLAVGSFAFLTPNIDPRARLAFVPGLVGLGNTMPC